MGIPADQILPNASFIHDFRFEEFQYDCLILYIGNYFEIDTGDCNIKELETIGNLLNFVSYKMETAPMKEDPCGLELQMTIMEK